MENVGSGEIVEVQGGHIVRSTARKDGHSKVCTAKGPRDRRVRLSAPTAIQFYDVQDRLGFDRPSNAVDWLIKKAKSAIDELPPWNPSDTLRYAKSRKTKTLISPQLQPHEETEHHHHHHHHHHHNNNQRQMREEDNESSFLPASMDSDSIADTIKSFFPVGIGACASTQQSYHHQPLSNNTQSQDLRLSLQSFQNGSHFADQTEHALFSNQSNPLGFNSSTASWNHQSPEFEKIQRLVKWNNSGTAEGGGFVFASPSSLQPVISQSQLLSQRGSLQSTNTPMNRAWFDPQHHHHHQFMTTDDLHYQHHNHQHHPYHIHQSAIPGIAFASSGELSGFRIPTRFQGEQEEHGVNNKHSSASSDSCH